MSEPSPSTVTPKIPISNVAPNVHPPCSAPYYSELQIGEYICISCDPRQPPAHWEWHRHDAVQVLILGKGAHCEIRWIEQGEERQEEIVGPHVWVLGALVLHEVRWQHAAQRTVFYVNPRFAREVTGRTISESMLLDLNKVERHDILVPQWLRAFSELRKPRTKADEEYRKALGTILVVHFLRVLKEVQGKSSASTAGLPPAVFERIEKLIERRLDSEIPLSEMAAEARMSANNFARRFKASTGMSPHQYHIRQRILKASRYLTSGEYRVSEVGYAVGIQDQSYFSRIFRKWMGCSPRHFARQR